MDLHLLSYYLGISIVIYTNAWMIHKSGPNLAPVINLVAVVLIAYYFMNKESFIHF